MEEAREERDKVRKFDISKGKENNGTGRKIGKQEVEWRGPAGSKGRE